LDRSIRRNANFPVRAYHTTTVFDNKLWLFGGYDGTANILKDAWYSEDGVTWVKATSSTPFSGRYGLTSATFDNKIWIIAGFDNDYKNDVWVMN